MRAFQCICIRPGDRSRQCVKPASSSIMAGAVPGASAPAAQARSIIKLGVQCYILQQCDVLPGHRAFAAAWHTAVRDSKPFCEECDLSALCLGKHQLRLCMYMCLPVQRMHVSHVCTCQACDACEACQAMCHW